MSCCPVTALPAVQGAAAIVGATKQFKSTSLFVAQPATPTKVGILALPDIFGLDSGRTKADAEALAQLGYAVAVVDLTSGDYMEPEKMSEFGSWLAKNTFEDVLSVHLQEAIEFLQSEFKVESIVSYGYCWGGYVGARQSALRNPIIKGNVSFHPSWGVENMVNGEGAVEKLTERITVPQLLLAAGDDPAFVRENGSVIKILWDKPETSAHSQVIDFPDMNHGWVNRGDVEKPEVKAGVAKAWHTALKFIQTVAPQ
uniref:Dienelactone hydrolase domain-containing protein n=1 Tax=Globisporangium ultimum (strain ATCC 200006 / CBS 805.95 / DAOM BR144) TaxID=431595 RepID=K3WXS0_GLOUD